MIKGGANGWLIIDNDHNVWTCSDATMTKEHIASIVDAGVGYNASFFVDEDGQIYIKGSWFHEIDKKEKFLIPKVFPLVETKMRSVLVSHTGAVLFIDYDGAVWGCGTNNFGQLGLGHTSKVATPTRIPVLSEITDIKSGEHHTLFLDENKQVWGCGYNQEGQLGLPLSRGSIRTPIKLEIPCQEVQKIAGGYDSFFLDTEGSVYSCGWNFHAQLGLSHKNIVSAPEKVELPTIEFIAAGYLHALFLDVDGKVWSSGNNSCGQTGRGLSDTQQHFLGIIPTLPRIVAIYAGYQSSFFVDETLCIWACGKLGVKRMEHLPVPIEFPASFVPRNHFGIRTKSARFSSRT